MLERVRASQYSPGVVDIKYSPGALMDIEFAVQALQMRYARQNPALRVTRTADVLRALVDTPPVAVDFVTLSKLFERLRTVESRLRMTDLRGVSAMPTDPRALAILARRLGLIGDDVGATLDAEIRQILAESRALVGAIFEKISF
ncbi:MAG: hypothetical protein R3E66_18655 [bacterium]